MIVKSQKIRYSVSFTIFHKSFKFNNFEKDTRTVVKLSDVAYT